MTNATSAPFAPGAIVRYAVPDAGEADYRFTVLECADGRAHIRLVSDAYAIAPIETVAVADIAHA